MHWCDVDTYCNANSTCEPLFISHSSPMSIHTYNKHSHQHSQTNSLTDPQRVLKDYSTLHKTLKSLVQQHKMVFMSVSAIRRYDLLRSNECDPWPPPLWQLWSFNGCSFPSCIMRRLQVVAFLRGLTCQKMTLAHIVCWYLSLSAHIYSN